MIKEAIGTGATVEAAIEAAKLALDAPEDADISTEILETPSKKTLGLFGGTQAKARVYYEETEYAKAERYIKTVLRLMGVEANVLTVEEDDGVRFSLNCGKDDGYIIGRRGETLDAVQYLTRLVVSRGREDYKRVQVNVGDYREQHEQALRELAISTAGKAKKYGRNMTLPPMTPYDRRIIHTAVQEFDGANSFSVGEGAERRVVVAPDEQYRRPDNRRPGGYGQRDTRSGGGGGRGNLQRNQRNAQPRRFNGDREGGYQQREGGYQQREGGYQQREGGYQRRDGGYQQRDGGYRRDDRRGDYRGGGGRSQGSQQPNRPPRSDAQGAGRYGRIEPKHEDKGE
ncbi:MAG: Jag N-terminal domain-containing protein [Oscillospiraceae bacterium]|jgi:spoIIIJ-associated protein|nr:Jag N-terminal domain-containing protein [Oscillospiraceae bacterium]